MINQIPLSLLMLVPAAMAGLALATLLVAGTAARGVARLAAWRVAGRPRRQAAH